MNKHLPQLQPVILGLLLTGRQILSSTKLKEYEKPTKYCFAIFSLELPSCGLFLNLLFIW